MVVMVGDWRKGGHLNPQQSPNQSEKQAKEQTGSGGGL